MIIYNAETHIMTMYTPILGKLHRYILTTFWRYLLEQKSISQAKTSNLNAFRGGGCFIDKHKSFALSFLSHPSDFTREPQVMSQKQPWSGNSIWNHAMIQCKYWCIWRSRLEQTWGRRGHDLWGRWLQSVWRALLPSADAGCRLARVFDRSGMYSAREVMQDLRLCVFTSLLKSLFFLTEANIISTRCILWGWLNAISWKARPSMELSAWSYRIKGKQIIVSGWL